MKSREGLPFSGRERYDKGLASECSEATQTFSTVRGREREGGIMSNAVVDYHCPKCGQTDSVAKISALFSRETVQARYAGIGVGASAWNGAWAGTFALSGSQQTLLSTQLAPPARPKPALRWGFSSITFLAVTALAVILTLLTGLLYVVSPPHDPSIAQGAASLLAITILCVLISFVLLVRRSKSRRRIAEEERLRYEQAMHRWEQLYYCARNDLVFLPGDPQVSGSPSNMRTVLSQASDATGVV